MLSRHDRMSVPLRQPSRTAIIVIAWHGQRWIPGCIASVDDSMEREEHLYLVDNSGNGDCIPQSVRNCRYEVLRTGSSLGFAAANNFALPHVDPALPYVCFLNQDTLCRPGWLERCVEVLDRNPQIGAVSPMLYAFGWGTLNPNFAACVREVPELTRDCDRGPACRPFCRVSEIPAAAMVVRAAVLREVGPFDPIFGSYYEDYDLCLRIRQAGYDVGVCPLGEVAHYDSVTDEDLRQPATRRRHQLILRNRAILKIRRSRGPRLLALAGVLGIDLPRHLVRALLKRTGHKSVRSIFAAWGSLVRLSPRLVSAAYDDKCRLQQLLEFRQQFQADHQRTARTAAG